MRRNIIREDEHRRLAIAYEIARYSEDEVGVSAVHLGQKSLDHLHRDVRPPLDQLRTPACPIVFVEKVSHLWPRPAGLCQDGRDNAIGRALQKIPNEGTTDAEAHHHEFAYAQVVHDAKLIIGV